MNMSTELVVYETPQKQQRRSFVATPYQCAKIVNAAFRELGLAKEIPPQMLYTYVRKGYILGGRCADGRIVVDEESFRTWLPKYLTKAQKNFKS
jgi:hypothetical protein